MESSSPVEKTERKKKKKKGKMKNVNEDVTKPDAANGIPKENSAVCLQDESVNGQQFASGDSGDDNVPAGTVSEAITATKKQRKQKSRRKSMGDVIGKSVVSETGGDREETRTLEQDVTPTELPKKSKKRRRSLPAKLNEVTESGGALPDVVVSETSPTESSAQCKKSNKTKVATTDPSTVPANDLKTLSPNSKMSKKKRKSLNTGEGIPEIQITSPDSSNKASVLNSKSEFAKFETLPKTPPAFVKRAVLKAQGGHKTPSTEPRKASKKVGLLYNYTRPVS